MKNWNRQTLILMLAVLIVVPLLTEWHFVWRDLRAARRELKQQQKGDALLSKYECRTPSSCSAVDFNGDGIYEFLSVGVVPGLEGKWLSVEDMTGVSLLMLPFGSRSDYGRTRIAVVKGKGESHLLVYNESTWRKYVYRYDGERMLDTPPTPLESDVLSAMEAGAVDPRRRDEIAFRSFLSFIKLFCYYFVLVVVVAVVGYKRRNAAGGGGSPAYHFMRGHP